MTMPTKSDFNPSLIWFVCLLVMMFASLGIGQAGDELPPLPLSDAPQPSYRLELLELGFQTASAIRIQPHVKDRSRTQELIVGACLELNQPLRARRYLAQIANWRQGVAWADLAHYAVRHGLREGIEPFLQRAEVIAQTADQEWRRDRVLARIAQVRTQLGQIEQAKQLAQQVESNSEQLVVEQDEERKLAELHRLLASGDFDLMVTAVRGFLEIYRRADSDRRESLEQQIKSGSQAMPVDIQVQLLLQLSEAASELGLQEDARRFVDDAQTKLDGGNWLPEIKIPLMASIARRRHIAGQTEAAQAGLRAARNLFEQSKPRIQSFERAGALCPVAEAYAAMQDRAQSLAVYRLAIHEGAVNPNARPRAEDLAATCGSMALADVEPDAELWAQMKAIHQGLGDPW